MHIEVEDLRALSMVGFLAAARGRVDEANAIFKAVEIERPTSAAAFVGMALAHLTVGRTVEALAVLDRGLKVQGQADLPELHAFRGLALQLSGRAAESLKALRQAGPLPLAKAMLGEPSTT